MSRSRIAIGLALAIAGGVALSYWNRGPRRRPEISARLALAATRPESATIDLSAGYAWKKISLLCKVSNITNALSYTVHENYSVNPIAPRQVLANLTYKF